MLCVGRRNDVLIAAKEMIPYCVKKRIELLVIVEYLEDRITASQAIAVFNQEVTSGKRIGITRRVNLPYTRRQGLSLGLESRIRLLSALTRDEEMEIRRLHYESGRPAKELSRAYGVSVWTIRRVIRASS